MKLLKRLDGHFRTFIRDKAGKKNEVESRSAKDDAVNLKSILRAGDRKVRIIRKQQ